MKTKLIAARTATGAGCAMAIAEAGAPDPATKGTGKRRTRHLVSTRR